MRINLRALLCGPQESSPLGPENRLLRAGPVCHQPDLLVAILGSFVLCCDALCFEQPSSSIIYHRIMDQKTVDGAHRALIDGLERQAASGIVCHDREEGIFSQFAGFRSQFEC